MTFIKINIYNKKNTAMTFIKINIYNKKNTAMTFIKINIQQEKYKYHSNESISQNYSISPLNTIKCSLN